MKQNIFIVASGTGGHVIPANNIERLLLDSNYQVTWIGTRHGIENKIVNDKRISFKYLNSSGIRGKTFFNKIKGSFNLFRSLTQSLIHINRGIPIFIIGFGLYIPKLKKLRYLYLEKEYAIFTCIYIGKKVQKNQLVYIGFKHFQEKYLVKKILGRIEYHLY